MNTTDETNNQLKQKCEKCIGEIKNMTQNFCKNCQKCTAEHDFKTTCKYYKILKVIKAMENER